MLSSSLAPDAATVDITVRALCSASRLDHIVQLLKEFASKHCPPDTFTINHLLKHLCKSRPLSSIYAFIDEMCYDFALKPDLVTYTILIDNVCNSKNLREATRLVVVLHREGFKPDCFLYNTIMKGYCALSRGREAIEVYNKMKEQGVEPDLVTYNTLIFALSKFERVSEAKKLLRVGREGLLPRRGHLLFLVWTMLSTIKLNRQWLRLRMLGGMHIKKLLGVGKLKMMPLMLFAG
uniref:Pentatricopeptide repeat-containing protein At2g17670 family n=1 Tax=Cajanus cajan TaxID=3821 RepID=A0A151QQX7_CAJCA|nr:Pentatricopeptide repeat-containing protein At2g17670 family [Cajanus cajan]